MQNQWNGTGRLVKDPELKHTGSGAAVVSFTIACGRDYKNSDGEYETDFFDIVAWKTTAEFVSRFFEKGSLIQITGRLQTRSWTDKDNNKRKTVEIVADHCYFGGGRSEKVEGADEDSRTTGKPVDVEFTELDGDDDGELPF